MANANIHIPLFYLQRGCKHFRVGPLRLRSRKAAVQGVEAVAHMLTCVPVWQRVFRDLMGTSSRDLFQQHEWNISRVSSLWLEILGQLELLFARDWLNTRCHPGRC